MSTITKEWLQQKIADMEARRDDPWLGLDEDESNTLAALRITLASLEAEPVHQVLTGDAWVDLSKGAMESQKRVGAIVRTVYTATPAPVLPRDLEEIIFSIVNAMADEKLRGDESELFSLAKKYIEHAKSKLGAAMFKSFGNSEQLEPVTTAYKLPANTPCKDAPEHIWLQTAGAWPENGEFSELTWCSDNQHPDDTLYVRADVVTGNSPVIPDGLRLALSNAGIAAPESDEMLAATCEKYIQELVTWVKDRKPFRSAAPNQEDKA